MVGGRTQGVGLREVEAVAGTGGGGGRSGREGLPEGRGEGWKQEGNAGKAGKSVRSWSLRERPLGVSAEHVRRNSSALSQAPDPKGAAGSHGSVCGSDLQHQVALPPPGREGPGRSSAPGAE